MKTFILAALLALTAVAATQPAAAGPANKPYIPSATVHGR